MSGIEEDIIRAAENIIAVNLEAIRILDIEQVVLQALFEHGPISYEIAKAVYEAGYRRQNEQRQQTATSG